MESLNRQFGDYRLLAKIANGGQSEVFLGARSGPHGFFRPVVIKAMPDRLKGDRRMEALFYQEATLSSRFSHPNVVTIHDAKRKGDDHFMVMDFVAGQTIDEVATRVFSEGDELNWQEAVVMIVDACRGLDHVHRFHDIDGRRYQIVHCDISPQNLMVTYDGKTKVFDFGISQVVGESGASPVDLVGGKYAYMSPEQCLGKTLDQRSDIFSLGVILYELVTRQRLFRRDSSDEVIEAVTTEPIAAPGEVREAIDEELSAMIMKALAKAPDDRWESASVLAEALGEYLKRQEVSQDGVRKALGDKVARHFEEERQAVASRLQRARQELSEQVFGTSAKATPEPTVEQVDELEEELEATRAQVKKFRKRATRASDVAQSLTEEVKRLQGRQNWFIAGLLALALVSLGIASISFIGTSDASDEASEVVESNDP